ncbi:uncharacterized protein LOC108677242 [Hyalella azteca]|uniref:Uncharacterized protein LOC108677242 n=1 Tax=Hyalella azteca TaxID=294128 RepID=A0A8B7P487_HYAAZ|nr:uncharacterized protein LOC108677242 [Hyalella azteca]XP_018020929.1 uncharacterized protein LOC108677242 [Hyalella azteca]XP_018020930.1 uncharacterized protein LOC108677242 [Hyalella azteca]
MIPLKETIIASLQMLERLAGRNPFNCVVFGLDDTWNQDTYLDLDHECETLECEDQDFKYHRSSSESFNVHLRTSDASSNRSQTCNAGLFVNNFMKVSGSQEIGSEEPGPSNRDSCMIKQADLINDNIKDENHPVSCSLHQLNSLLDPRCNQALGDDSTSDLCEECADHFRHHVSAVDHNFTVPSTINEGLNPIPNKCCICILRRIELTDEEFSDYHDSVRKETHVELKRRSRDKNQNLTQHNLRTNETDETQASRAGFQVEQQEETESGVAAISNELIDPDCFVCFRKHGEQDDDVTFKYYGVLSDCQHSFCKTCIASWLQQSAIDRWRCPVCRCAVLFTYDSPRWLPHRSRDKQQQLASTRARLLVTRSVGRKLTALLRLLLLYWTVGVKALRNLVEEITPEFEPLLHRHEIGSFI